MMREIKFRGKRIDNGAWVYGYYSKVHFGTAKGFLDAIVVFDSGSTIPTMVIPETVGQYTSLKDKDGKEIYEGDIISDHVGIGYVKYDRFAAFCVYYGGNTAKWFVDYNLSGEMESIEIIGNIHDTPRTLEGVYQWKRLKANTKCCRNMQVDYGYSKVEKLLETS